MSALTHFAQSRTAWSVLLASALALELCALFFQYVMKLDPCVMCIYQRLAVLGLLIAGLIGVIGCRLRLLRFVAVLFWGVSATWGLQLALELVEMQTNPNPFSTCSFLPEFPAWMPLHEWLPSVFMPTGMCTDTPWELFSITMPQWMVVAFSGYLIALILFMIPALAPTKKA